MHAPVSISIRYLTERKLPDSAIDLMDEAASRMRMQQESKPEAVERVEREIATRLIEIEALKKETDSLSKSRLKKLQQEVRTVVPIFKLGVIS